MIPNRSQFADILQQGYQELFNQRIHQNLFPVICNERSALEEIVSDYLRIPGRIQFYLREYDEATNDQERYDVIRYFDPRDFGNEIVDPNNLIKGLDNGGRYPDGRMVLQRRSAIIDGTSIGNTLIFRTAEGERFIPVSLNFYLQQQSGLTVVATISVGSNGPSFTNILGATLLTGLSSSGSIIALSLSGIIPSVAPMTEVYARVSIPSTASTYNILCTVIGFMV